MKHSALSDADIYTEIADLISHTAHLILYSLAVKSVALDELTEILQWQILENIHIPSELQNDLRL